MSEARAESQFDAAWRRPAPRARRFAMMLYGWRQPGWVCLFALLAAAPFVFAAFLAPALLSLKPTAEMIGPIADARAIAAGGAPLKSSSAPFYSLLLLAADRFADSPGRIHLLAKGIAAALVAGPLAYLCAARFPAALSVLMTAALAAYAAAPFSGPQDVALAFFIVTATALICSSADNSASRARIEGVIAAAGLVILWLLSPAFSLAGFVTLAFSPLLAGLSGASRYSLAAILFVAGALLIEAAAPGMNIARAHAASAVFSARAAVGGEGAIALTGMAASGVVVIAAAAIFGGPEHWRSWGAGAGLLLVSLVAARFAEANATPIIVMAAALACFSTASPFYDGIFSGHDRASISIAVAAASLTLFWTGAIAVHAAGQFFLQHRTTLGAPENIRAELGLVQPGGPTIARWIEEGRFSTPEARDLFALAPVDQSEMLLEAAAHAKKIASYGLDVAILTGADAACVIAEKRACRPSGEKAANSAKVVFVPRLDLDPSTADAKLNSQALLYTEFKLVEQTPLWDVWVRRGATLPEDALKGLKGAL
ncbi:MAG: hypothetical protein GC153_09700 [Alphaproteobacteria bacterium]|nr:hypothetical protein [Alphaproteobacteria bacterium]